MSYQKRNQLLEIIQEYKSDNTALKEQIKDLKKQNPKFNTIDFRVLQYRKFFTNL